MITFLACLGYLVLIVGGLAVIVLLVLLAWWFWMAVYAWAKL